MVAIGKRSLETNIIANGDVGPAATARRVRPRLQVEHPTLRLREEDDLTFQFQHTSPCRVRRVDNAEQLCSVLSQETAAAVSTQQNWLRQAHAEWLLDMIRDLSPLQRRILARRHHRLQATCVPEDDVIGRWSEVEIFSSIALSLWMEDKSLEEVLERAEALGQMSMESGCILEGDLIDQLALSRNVTFEDLIPMVRKMSGHRDTVPVFKVMSHNSFSQTQHFKQPVSELKPQDGQGSLNTTWTYKDDSRSDVPMMDEFHDSVVQAIQECDEVLLNRRMYMIWKFPHYVTSYHQDTHVPPHFTIYNQVSGTSLFHFLPLLVGLYVTYVGRKDPEQLASVLKRLDEKRIGSLATLGPGQVALILPFGSHGVWVPSRSHNPSLPDAEVSLIRAAEIYLKPIFASCAEKLCDDRWNSVFECKSEQAADLKEFMRAQTDLCQDMSLSKQEWLVLARKAWDSWENKQSAESSDDEVIV